MAYTGTCKYAARAGTAATWSVCVVVRNKYGFYLSLIYTIVVEILLKRAYTHPCVYDDTFSVRFQVITVPTASTAE